MPGQRERRWWTSQEDEVLKNGVRTQGNLLQPALPQGGRTLTMIICEIVHEEGTVQNWNDIAALLPHRTNKDCRKRWSKIQLDIRKGAWTRNEDERLKHAVQQLGFKWCQVAILVQSRNADQCSKRWQHVLGPGFKHSPWAPEEDRKLLDAVAKYGNNWKQIGLSDLPDRSTHDIRNRSLLLGRRNQKSLSRGSVATQQPSPNGDDMSNDEPQRDEREALDDDDDAHDNTIEFDLAASSDAMAPHDISISSNFKMDDAMGIAQFQQPHSVSVTQIGTGSRFEPRLTDTARQVQVFGELPTPVSETLSWFDPLETTTPHGVASQTSWLGKSTMDQPLFQTPGFSDIGCFDVPGSRGESRSVECLEKSSNTSAYIHSENAGEHRKKGSVTLTLSRVDPYIAQEIMGSVLKHSAGLKIQCVVDDS
ncbi:MAG: hypothetical protein M1821_000502 [Bathelium mastoideum]|nr:MAG: hypothetical protein M1821_000502 [Bathelium mastoideum]